MTQIPEPEQSFPGGSKGSPSGEVMNPGAVIGPPPVPPGGFWVGGGGSGERPPRREGLGWRIVSALVVSVLLTSIGLNIWLGLYVFAQIHAGPYEATYQQGDPSQRIVILPIRGTIDDSMYEFVRSALQRLEQEPRPRAVVLRVDSPGGTVGASDRIWQEIRRFREKTQIPIVASYADVAASGGYYVSCLADYIVAEPTTITGSIGVMFLTFNVQELISKLGVEATMLTARTSPEKDLGGNLFRKWSEKDTQVVQPFLDRMHELFMKRVLEGRRRVVGDLTLEEVARAATGRVWFTQEAKELKLVDQEGYLEDALAKAKELAGMKPEDRPLINEIRARGGWLQSLGLFWSGGDPAVQLFRRSWTAEEVRSWLLELARPRLEYRWWPGED